MNTYEYDAFLSFAVEDKIEVANELHYKLEEKGLKVWYSGRELILGSSIEDQVRAGLDKSRYGILLISPSYFGTKWAIQEMGALWHKERREQQVIIPVFHNITPEEVGQFDPALSDRWAVSTKLGLDHVSEQIAKRISNKPDEGKKTSKSSFKRNGLVIALAIFSLLLLTSAFWYYTHTGFSKNLLTATIEQRIADFDQEVEQERTDLISLGTSGANRQAVLSFIEQFQSIDSHYRNYYYFSNGFQNWRFEKNVSPASGVDFDRWKASGDYGFKHPVISKLSQSVGNKKDILFIYFNTQPVSYKVQSKQYEEDRMVINVAYSQSIRLAIFRYEYGPQTSYRKHTTYTLFGFKPEEEYIFEKKRGSWTLISVH